MTSAIRVKDFKFIFGDEFLEVAHNNMGVWSLCYRAKWSPIMWMPDRFLPEGFHEALDKAKDILQKSRIKNDHRV
jgi:hypothetical protein